MTSSERGPLSAGARPPYNRPLNAPRPAAATRRSVNSAEGARRKLEAIVEAAGMVSEALGS